MRAILQGTMTVTLVALVVIALSVRVMGQPPWEEFHDHWKRCSTILKKSGTRSCTKSQVQACVGTKAYHNITSYPYYYCDAAQRFCPTLPLSLEANVYSLEPFLTRSNSYYGINVTWTIQQTGTDQDYVTKRFELRAEQTVSQIFIVEIEANLTESDYVTGMATIHYDCIYPIATKENYRVNVVLKTLPHARGDFLTTVVDTKPPTVATVPATTATVPTSSNGGTKQETPLDQSTVNQTHRLRKDGPENVTMVTAPTPLVAMTTLDQKVGWAYGLVGGLLGVLLLCVGGLMAHRHWRRGQRNTCFKKFGQKSSSEIVKTTGFKQQQNNSDRGRKTIALLFMNDDEKLAIMYTEFMKQLQQTSSYNVIDLLELGLDTQPYDFIQVQLSAADYIIVIDSEQLLPILRRVQIKYDLDLLQQSCDLPFLALFFIQNRLLTSPIHKRKVVSAYFEEKQPSCTDYCLSPWEAVALPQDFDKLVNFLQDQTTQKQNQCGLMEVTNLKFQVQLSTDSGDSGIDNGLSKVNEAAEYVNQTYDSTVHTVPPQYASTVHTVPPQPTVTSLQAFPQHLYPLYEHTPSCALGHHIHHHGYHDEMHGYTHLSQPSPFYSNPVQQYPPYQEYDNRGRSLNTRCPISYPVMPESDMDSVAIADAVIDINAADG